MSESTSWELAAAPESTDHVKIDSEYGLFINGEFVESDSKKKFASVNPATEQPLAEISESNEADVDRAVKAAKSAFKTWSKPVSYTHLTLPTIYSV